MAKPEVSSKDPALKEWYPEVEPSLHQFVILNKAMLVKYVLHAKHSKIFKIENIQ